MGIYGDRVLPHLINIVCGTSELQPLRERACAGLEGKVIEIGFGTGHNVDHYPASVTAVTAVEPSDLSWKLAAKRVGATTVPIERSGLDGQRLPFADATFDSALSTYTMCSIPDLPLALRELRRVLKPGGTLHFLEHGLAPDPKVRQWQHRLDPLEQRFAGGCRFTVEIERSIVEAGFAIVEVEHFYQPRGPKFAVAMSLGTAMSN